MTFSYGQAVHAHLVAAALVGIDDHDAVVAPVDGVDVAGRDARGIVAVLADAVLVRDLDLGHLATHVVVHLVPELARIGLRLGDGRPVVGHVLVFARHLAVVATVADVVVDHEDLTHHSPPMRTQASKPGPAQGWKGRSNASGYFFLRASRSVFSTSARKPLTAWPTAFLDVVLAGHDGVDGAAAVDDARIDGVPLGAVIHVDDVGHDALGHVRAAEHRAALVEDGDDVAVLDAARLSRRRVQPDRMVLVAVGTGDLAGLDLAEPGDVLVLRVDAPPRVVGAHQQRILLGALGAQGLLVADALGDPLGYRRPLEVVGEVLLEAGGLELQQTGGSGERVGLGIFVEPLETGRFVLPVLGRRDDQVALVVAGLPS